MVLVRTDDPIADHNDTFHRSSATSKFRCLLHVGVVPCSNVAVVGACVEDVAREGKGDDMESLTVQNCDAFVGAAAVGAATGTNQRARRAGFGIEAVLAHQPHAHAANHAKMQGLRIQGVGLKQVNPPRQFGTWHSLRNTNEKDYRLCLGRRRIEKALDVVLREKRFRAA